MGIAAPLPVPSPFGRVPVVAIVATLCSVGTVSYPTARGTARAPASPHQHAAPPARTPIPHTTRIEEYRIAAGTALPIELRTALSSEESRRDDGVEGRLLRAVTAGDVELIPAGAAVLGTVTSVERARAGAPGHLAFAFTVVQHPETGSRATIRATPRSFRTDVPARRKPLPTLSLAKGTDATVTLLQPLVVRIPVY